MAERLYRPDEAAKLLGCGRTRVYAFIKSGELRSVKLGGSRRIPRSAIEEFIESLDDVTAT
ncbi:helix-turn-helix domain-containing protein [Mycobacterium intracellulare]|uniref:helix-turn-helix domain-containing protein n=1 Tax=Mycobacterium intracellulare TaxID=1767 RepID=UPI00334F4B27